MEVLLDPEHTPVVRELALGRLILLFRPAWLIEREGRGDVSDVQ
jgi:hypothetical protein